MKNNVDENKQASGNVQNREGRRQHLIFSFFNKSLKKIWTFIAKKHCFLRKEEEQSAKTFAIPYYRHGLCAAVVSRS